MTDCYVMDTNSFWKLAELRVDPAGLDRVWANLAVLSETGHLTTVDIVLEELERQEQQACLDRMAKLTAETMVRRWKTVLNDPYGSYLQQVVTAFPSMSGALAVAPPDKGAPHRKADPFLVALAKGDGAVLVTQEARDKKQKLPNACNSFDVECIDVADFLIRARLDRDSLV